MTARRRSPGNEAGNQRRRGLTLVEITVSTDANGTVTSIGDLETPGGKLLAQKTLVCPNGDTTRIFDTSL
ncbi:MAG: hypothetical protein ACYCW6_29880 [Candidatus Xenobia bacterium]